MSDTNPVSLRSLQVRRGRKIRLISLLCDIYAAITGALDCWHGEIFRSETDGSLKQNVGGERPTHEEQLELGGQQNHTVAYEHHDRGKEQRGHDGGHLYKL